MQLVRLQSSDGGELVVDHRVAIRSSLIRTLLEDVSGTDAADNSAIPLNNVTLAVLKRVVDYCDHHRDDPIIHNDIAVHPDAKPSADGDQVAAPQAVYDEIVSKQKRRPDEWDSQFLASLDNYDTYDVILAANYLEIPDLLDLICSKVAAQIKNKSPQEIRDELNIVQDLTPEEVDRICRENEWAADA